MTPTPYYADELVTLYRGDARTIVPQLDTDTFAAMVTDPPYGVAFTSGWTGASIAGDESTATRDTVLAAWPGRALVFAAIGYPEPPGVVARLVWHRPGSGMGDLSLPWKPDHELVLVIGHGWVGDHRGPGVVTFPWDTFRGDARHPHRKPVPLMRYLLRHVPPGPVLDPFAGSGSTLVAARAAGRRAIGIERDAAYCEVTAARLGGSIGAIEPGSLFDLEGAP